MSSQDYYNKKLANQYTDYVVKEPCELLQFLMTYVPGNTRTKAKQLLSQKMVYVDKVSTFAAWTARPDCQERKSPCVQKQVREDTL